MLNEHQNKTVEFIDRIGALLHRVNPSASAPSSHNGRLIDRHLESLKGSVREIQRGVGILGIGNSVLTKYLEEIVRL